MTNKQLYFVNRSVLFLAIAYAINGYTLPALACSIISAFLTCEFIGYEKVKNSLMQVVVMGIILIGMIRMVGLQVNLPMLELSAYASALCGKLGEVSFPYCFRVIGTYFIFDVCIYWGVIHSSN